VDISKFVKNIIFICSIIIPLSSFAANDGITCLQAYQNSTLALLSKNWSELKKASELKLKICILDNQDITMATADIGIALFEMGRTEDAIARMKKCNSDYYYNSDCHATLAMIACQSGRQTLCSSEKKIALKAIESISKEIVKEKARTSTNSVINEKLDSRLEVLNSQQNMLENF